MPLERLQKKLEELKASENLRTLREVQSPQGRSLLFQGREYLNFSSNDYLGLAEAPELREAMARGARDWGAGSGASRLVNGSLAPLHRLEAELAEFKGTEAALLFNSGYHANLGTMSCLLETGDVLFSDELNHASIIDGARLSRAQRVIYRHHDVEDLRRKLKVAQAERSPSAQFLIATETVFSMDGDLCPLRDLLELAEAFDAWLYFDEAHALGVFGKSGAGRLEEFRKHPAVAERVIQMGTLGKALGCFGAYVAGSRFLIDFLINRARSFIFTTALPPAVAEAARAALKLLKTQPERRARLWQNLEKLQKCAAERLPFSLRTESPIVPLLCGSSQAALRAGEGLLEKGIWATAIRPPTVPEGTARLRLTLTAMHQDSDIERLVEALCSVMK
ncbi:MAG TPA: 8-amino-7-oxononanoate synthase [Deltaproteobacteria bacterium]|nr:8-amino-7-oxononanoate synthase [Deltaproteobacteria bacterium]